VERFFEEFARLPGPVDTQMLAALMHEHYVGLVAHRSRSRIPFRVRGDYPFSVEE
jgi:hypothetical protein